MFTTLRNKVFLSYILMTQFAFAVNFRYNSSRATDPLHVYIHVPKCAGTSFSEAMGQASRSSQWWPIDTFAEGCAESRTKEEDIVFSSHCGLSELESCIQSGKACVVQKPEPGLKTCQALVPASAPLRFVMLIRDPVQRVLSEYYFFRVVPQATDERTKVLAQRLWTPAVRDIAVKGSITDWVRAAGNRAHNAITKAIVDGRAGHRAPILRQSITGHISSCVIFDEEDYTSHWQQYYHSPSGSDLEALINSDQGLLSAAVAIIETRFDFVGLVEHFDESVARLSSLLGITPVRKTTPDASSHTSDKPQDGQISSNVIREVKKRNALDAGLYSAVIRGKFWAGSGVAAKALVDEEKFAQLTWQSILDGDREGKVFDPQVLSPSTEAH